MTRWIVRTAVAVALGAAAFGLWSWSSSDGPGRGVQGGPLFDFTVDQVSALEIRRPGVDGRIERTADGWTLTGDIPDFVDADRFEPILDQVVAGNGFPVIAGTDPDARRYGFGSEGSVELVFHLQGGGRDRLALGDANPVSEMIYASGAGRTGVFGIDGGLYSMMVRLPHSVRLAHVLPKTALADLDSLRILRRDDEPLRFARSGGRWWLQLTGGEGAMVGKVGRYHHRYDDRREMRDGALWLVADEPRLRDAVYRASSTVVVGFPTADMTTPASLAEVGLDPPYRGIDLYRHGRDASWRLEFGEEQIDERKVVWVRREGTPVIVRSEALHPLEGAVSDFVDLGALSVRIEAADSLRVDGPDRPLLWGDKASDSAARREVFESVWDPVIPAGWRPGFDLETSADHLSDVQMHLDRLGCLAILDKVADDPLAAKERWRVRAWFPDGSRYEAWLGRLADSGDAVLWEPADGKVLRIDGEILVTLRNLRASLRAE